jgi:hypothetical protein
MPVVTIRTGIADANGGEETLSEYLCDFPDCPNVAVHVVGVARELNMSLAVCVEHAARLESRDRNRSQS